VWFERKVKEWGCMQALIDFDGWRKWKDFAAQNEEADKAKPVKDKKGKGLANKRDLDRLRAGARDSSSSASGKSEAGSVEVEVGA